MSFPLFSHICEHCMCSSMRNMPLLEISTCRNFTVAIPGTITTMRQVLIRAMRYVSLVRQHEYVSAL